MSQQSATGTASADDAQEPKLESASAETAGKNNRLMRFLLLVVVPILAIVIALVFYFRGGRYVSTENAYVKSNIIAVSSDVSARAMEVRIRNNELVKKGDVMFTLDTEPLRLGVMETQARLGVVRADIQGLRAEYSEAIVEVAEAEGQVEYFRQEFQRQKKMKKQGIGGGQAHDEALFELRAARQRVKIVGERVKGTLASFNGNPDLPVEQHPAYQSALAQHERAQSLLAKATVIAPANGIVSNVQLQPGEYVKAGEAIFTLIENERIWVEANLKETQLTHVREGQSATLQVDAYPDVEWNASVASIAPATGAQFTLLPPQNATGNWVKVVQRIPVDLTVEQSANMPVLRAGMTVSVKIDTEHKRQAPALFGKPASADAADQSSLPVLETQSLLKADPRETISSDTVPREAKPVVIQTAFNTSAAAVPIPATANSSLITEQSPDLYTLQLMSSTNIETLKAFARELPATEKIMLYHFSDNDRNMPVFALAMGLYESEQSAAAVVAGLTGEVQGLDPTIKMIGNIQSELLQRQNPD